MKRGEKTLVIVAGGLLLCAVAAKAFAGAPGVNPYQGIVDRNVFQLRPPPPPPTNVAQIVQPPKITLTGITTILGNKRALLKWPVPAKPGQPAKEESFMLAEGQSESDVAVTEIDERAGVVRVTNHGQPQSLNFDDNGAKLVTAPPMAVPTAANPAIPRPIVPTTPARSAAAAAAPTTIRTIPQRTMRLPPAGGGAVVSGAPGGVVYPGTTPASQPQAQGRPLSVEEQALFIEAQRLKYQQEGNPLAETLPPMPTSMRQPQGGQPQAQ